MSSPRDLASSRDLARDLDRLLGTGDTIAGVATLCEQMGWADDATDAAAKRHPEQGDLMYHGFTLLQPTHDLMTTRFVYDAHAAELLDRLAAGHDTRPGTAAEVCCQCCDASQVATLTTTACGLYARMWAQAFPGHGDQWALSSEHYEALNRTLIDDLEREARRKLTRPDRRIREITCGGMHHGERVACTALAPGQRQTALFPATG